MFQAAHCKIGKSIELKRRHKVDTFKVVRATMIFALLHLPLRAAVLREIPFQEVAASFWRLCTTACHGGAAVEAVVVREGMLLVTGVVVLV